MLTGHGRTRAYLHRFNYVTTQRASVDKTTKQRAHLLNHCSMIHTQREVLKQNILKKGNWPASKQELITNCRNSFTAFIESIDFELL